MKKKYKILLTFLFFINILSLPIYSSNIHPKKTYNNKYKKLTFEHLSIENGLSQITVNAVLQDSKGFLWFGTEDGLNRYDGYKFEIFRPEPNNKNSINDNFIWTIYEDSKNNLWIGTNSGGLNKFNYTTNIFENYKHIKNDKNSISSNNIRVIFEDKQNVLWIGTNDGGIDTFDERLNQFKHVKLFSGNKKNTSSIRAICEDDYGNLWIGTDGNGLIKFNKSRQNITVYKDKGSRNSISGNNIWSLLIDKDFIWIGTYKNGLDKLNIITNKLENYSSKNNKRIINNNITDLMLDDSRHLWITTEDGLSILDTKTGSFINYQHNISDFSSISNNFVRTAMQDNSGLIWLGTVGGGVNKVNLNRKFKHYFNNPSSNNSLSHNVIRSIYEDSYNNIWIGTLGKGLNKFNKQNNTFRHFFNDSKKKYSLSSNIVSSIFEDEKNNLWVGTWGGGLNHIIFKEKSRNSIVKKIQYFNHNPKDNKSISNNIVQAIFKDSKKNFWIGTEEGLNLFDNQSGEFIHFKNEITNPKSLSDNRVQSKCIIEDRVGNIWIGTWKGLNKITANQKITKESARKITFQRFLHNQTDSNSISDNRILSIYEDENSKPNLLVLWVGTIGGGLNKLTIKMNGEKIESIKFINYTKKDGLANNVIYGILGDDSGNLWLSTNNGISKFNPTTEKFRNYDIRDGLQSNQFYWGAFCKARDGELFFGGVNGFNSFYPNQLKDNTHIPPVYITNISIVNNTSGNKNNYIKKSLWAKNKIIKLPYDTYTLFFEFAALDFITPQKNQYKYKLENIDETWVNSFNKNNVQYSNLKEGNYKFTVLGSNNDGLWNNKGASVTIIIETPFWKTWWFVILSFLFLASLVGYFIYTQVQNMLAVERLRTKLAADLHDSIGSSLTEISILSEVISTRLKNVDDDVKKSLSKISNKSRSLIDKMSDIVWLVNPQRDSLYDLILRLQDTYSELLADTSISFRSENLKSLEKISLSMEHRQHLFLIFKEAINNSIMHSKCTEIILNARIKNKKLEMLLEDNGKGFEFNDLKRGNGLTNMEKRAKIIGGKLTIKSTLGKGTKVKYIGNVV